MVVDDSIFVYDSQNRLVERRDTLGRTIAVVKDPASGTVTNRVYENSDGTTYATESNTINAFGMPVL